MDTKELSKRLIQAKRSSWGKLNPHRWRVIQNNVHGKVLDIGCSSGDYVVALNKLGFKAFGIDLLVDSVWNYNDIGVFSQGEICNLPFNAKSFDIVLAFEVLEHLKNPESALREINRVCKNKLILSVPDCEVPLDVLSAGLIYSHWLDPTHYQYYNRTSLINQIEQCDFSVTEVSRINPILPDTLIYTSFYIPIRLAHFLSRITLRIPFRKRYFRTILILAKKVQ